MKIYDLGGEVHQIINNNLKDIEKFVDLIVKRYF